MAIEIKTEVSEETLRTLDPWGAKIPCYSSQADFEWYAKNRTNSAYFDQPLDIISQD